MSFYIKSFRLSPQALEKGNAVPDKSTFSIETDVAYDELCGEEEFYFEYSAGDKKIASSYQRCRNVERMHEVNDGVRVKSRAWGGGSLSKVPIMVSVKQASCGEIRDAETFTWVIK